MAGIRARNRIQPVAPLVVVVVLLQMLLCLWMMVDPLALNCSSFPGGLQHESGSPSRWPSFVVGNRDARGQSTTKKRNKRLESLFLCFLQVSYHSKPNKRANSDPCVCSRSHVWRRISVNGIGA